jgi:hypothetical protein
VKGREEAAVSPDQIDENRIIRLEAEFVRGTGATCVTAFQQAIDAGLTVLVSKEGRLVEVSPDGTERVVGLLKPSTPVKPGTKFTLR